MSISPEMKTENKSSDGDLRRMYTAEHYSWLLALEKNDVETVLRMLEEADSDEREVLLEGWIDTDLFWKHMGGDGDDMKQQEALMVCRPFPLAAVCASVEVMEELVKQGINACQVDGLGNNVVHAMIIYSSQHQEWEEHYLKVYGHLTSVLPDNGIEELILAENTDGLRPVELAAYYQALRILNAIYNTPGHYVHKSLSCGMMSIIRYHIDEYEGLEPTRPFEKSPLFILVHLGHKKLDDDYTKYFFTKSFFATWMSSKRKSYMLIVLLWFLIRLFVISVAFLAAGLTSPVASTVVCGYKPGLSDGARMAFTVIMLVFAVMGLSFDVWDMMHLSRGFPAFRKRYAPHQGHRFVRYWNYRATHVLFNVSAVVLCINKICGHYGETSMPIYWTEVFIVTFTICSIWALLFFGQLTESLGNYITATQQMINDLFRFGMLIMMFIVPFMFTFGNFMLRDTSGTCPAEYTGVASSLYSGFEISQNLQDIRGFASPNKEGLWLAHVAYVILVVILLLNFLISIFTDSYATVAANPDIIYELQWLSVLATIDGRIPTCLRPLLHKMKRQFFAVEGSLEKLAVKTFEMKKIEASSDGASTPVWSEQ